MQPFSEQAVSGSTWPDPAEDSVVWDRRFRWATYLLLAVILIAAAVGLLGVSTTRTTASANGYDLTVTHGIVTRPGVATPFMVEVSSSDGAPLPARLMVGVTSSYLRMLDDNGMEPLPTGSFNTADTTWWTFDIPSGESSLLVDVDARLEPAVQWGGGSARAEVWVDGEMVVSTEFSTWVMP